jgi:hypothetical protein
LRQRCAHNLAQLGVHGALVACCALAQLLLEIVVEVAQHDVGHGRSPSEQSDADDIK